MDAREPTSTGRRLWHGTLTALGAVGGMLACFLLLPVLQMITQTVSHDLELRDVDLASLPPPPPPVEEEQEPEKPPEDPEPPKLVEDAPPLDLTQLEMALNPGLGGGDLAGDYAIKIQGLGGGAKGEDDLFSLADLDQKPRALLQQQPVLTAALRKRLPATVNILFVVDESGRVENPIVQNSSDPQFEAAALAAIRQWKFEPGKRAGKPVRFRMRQPMTFK